MKKIDIKDWDIDASWTLFLDRDGTINQRVSSYIMEWKDFHFLPKALQAMELLAGRFGKIVIVTNQQCVGKELITIDELHKIHHNMMEVIEYFGGRVDQIYFEPSLVAYDSYRRKPKPGMAIDAQKDFSSIDFKKSIMIGDTLSDMEMGKAVGMKTIWIENQWEKKNKSDILKKSDIVIGGLYDFCGLL